MKKILLFSIIIFINYTTIYAQINKVPANKNPIEYKQPDGTVLTIILSGDENLHWAETSDGYTLLSNSIEGYEYAVLDKKQNLIISGKLAHQPDLRSKKEKKFLKKLQKGLKFSDSQIKNSKKTI